MGKKTYRVTVEIEVEAETKEEAIQEGLYDIKELMYDGTLHATAEPLS